jgi:putative transposase
MAEYIHESHSIYDIKYHIVRVTKYRYKILTKRIGERLRELLGQECAARGITIVEGEYRERAYAYANFVSAGHSGK